MALTPQQEGKVITLKALSYFFDQLKAKTLVAMKGASSTADGEQGFVPKPSKGDENKFLRADGTWQTVNASATSDIRFEVQTDGSVNMIFD